MAKKENGNATKSFILRVDAEMMEAIEAWAADEFIIRKSKFPPNPERSVQFSGKRTKRSVQKKGCTQHL